MSEQRLVKDFQDLQVGDKVVYSDGSYMHETPHKNVTVEKVTKTQFTAGGIRFNKRTGYRIGFADVWSRTPRIVGRYRSNHLFTWEQADERNKEIIAEIDRKNLAYKIQKTRFDNLDIDTLKQVASVLGIEIKQENKHE